MKQHMGMMKNEANANSNSLDKQTGLAVATQKRPPLPFPLKHAFTHTLLYTLLHIHALPCTHIVLPYTCHIPSCLPGANHANYVSRCFSSPTCPPALASGAPLLARILRWLRARGCTHAHHCLSTPAALLTRWWRATAAARVWDAAAHQNE